MEISASMNSVNYTQKSTGTKTVFTEKLTKDEVAELREQITENTTKYAFESVYVQGSISNSSSFEQDYADFQNFLSDIGYSGKPIAELTQDEAAELVSEDGIFGVKQTSERLANFVINGAGGDEDRLRAGREGLIRGYEEAERMWGGELPEISQVTMEKALEMVDKEMADLGYSILDAEV